MKAKVTKRGVVIPRELLEGIEEVDIRKENGVIIVAPVGEQDPIWGLGKNPVKSGPDDASENHDRYIYG
jgi:virulence-associated protein VagC